MLRHVLKFSRHALFANVAGIVATYFQVCMVLALYADVAVNAAIHSELCATRALYADVAVNTLGGTFVMY